MDGRVVKIDLPEGMSPAKLREIAGWLDTYDRMAAKFTDHLLLAGEIPPLEAAKLHDVTGGKQVQRELLAWADAIEEQCPPFPKEDFEDEDADELD